MPGSVWFLLAFVISEIIVAFWIAFYIICPCCWPFEIFNSVCHPQLDPHCPHPPCVRKCCPLGQELDSINNVTVCLPSNSSTFSLSVVPLWKNGSVENNSMVESDYTQFSVVSFGLCPFKMFELEQAVEDGFALQEDGSLIMFITRDVIYLDDFCLDSYIDYNVTVVFQCFPPIPDMSETELAMFPLGMAISLLFLLLTVLVYMLLPELQNLHGRTLFCHVASMTIGFLFLFIIQMDMNKLSENTTFCKISCMYTVVLLVSITYVF